MVLVPLTTWRYASMVAKFHPDAFNISAYVICLDIFFPDSKKISFQKKLNRKDITFIFQREQTNNLLFFKAQHAE